MSIPILTHPHTYYLMRNSVSLSTTITTMQPLHHPSLFVEGGFAADERARRNLNATAVWTRRTKIPWSSSQDRTPLPTKPHRRHIVPSICKGKRQLPYLTPAINIVSHPQHPPTILPVPRTDQATTTRPPLTPSNPRRALKNLAITNAETPVQPYQTANINLES